MKSRKILAFILCIVLVVSVLSVNTFAYSVNGNSYNRQYEKLCASVDEANFKIVMLVRYAQLTPYDDVDWLLFQVDNIVASVRKQADKIGATIECEYTTYYIDGRYVDIDPIRVIN